MMRMGFFVVLLFIPVMAWALDESSEHILHQEFIPTAFGVKSRTLDKKDAEAVIKAAQNYILSAPKAEISRLELLTCASDYRLPPMTLTDKRINEHWHLAKERNDMVIKELEKILKLPVTGQARVCGPEFVPTDLNDRFVTKESGALYESKFQQLLKDPAFQQQLKEEAMIDEAEKLKSLYPSPFLAKYKPFQGIRLFIFGHIKQAQSKKSESKKSSGKTQ